MNDEIWHKRFMHVWNWLPSDGKREIIRDNPDVEEWSKAIFEAPKESGQANVLGIGVRVYVSEHMPPWMKHFDCGFEAIIDDMTITQGEISYSVIELDSDNQPVVSHAWYPGDLLMPISMDRTAGCRIIDRYIRELDK